MSRILKAVSLSSTPFLINHSNQSIIEKDNVINLLEQKEKSENFIRQSELRGKELLESAQAEATAIKQQALLEVEEIKQKTYETAYQQGMAEGRKQGLLSIQQEMSTHQKEAIQQAENIIKLANNEAHSAVLSAEREIVDMAIEIARNVIGGELMLNSEAVLPIVRAALDKVKDQENIRILVNAEDYESVLAALPQLQKKVTSHRLLEVQVDPSIGGLGGCIINTAYGSVDARIDTGLSAIATALKEVMP